MPFSSRRLVSSFARLVDRLTRVVGEVAQQRDRRLARPRAPGVPTSAVSPSDLNAGMPVARERGERARAMRLTSVPVLFRFVATGVISRGHRVERRHRRRQLLDELREQLEVPLEVRAPLGGRLGRDVALHDRVRDGLALLRPLRQHPVAGLRARRASSLFWRARIASTLSSSRSAGFGLPDHRAQVLAAAREPGAELVQDDREALAVRAAHHAADQVLPDRRDGVATPAAGTGRRRPGRPGSCAAAAEAGRPPAAAGSARTRRASRRSPTGAGSGTRRRGGSPGTPARRSSARPRRACPASPRASSTLPTFAPATITSSPGIANAALSKIARTL